MNHLIISAHPSDNSFTNYLSKNLLDNYLAARWNTNLRNLYKIGFSPVLAPSDLESLKKGTVPADIEVEQEFIRNADLISVIYPLWWASFPAILKGYIDRVLSNGFAFNYGLTGIVGLLSGKKVILHTTMGNTVEEYEEKGLIDAFKKSQGEEVFGFCGMTVSGHYFYPQITLADEKQREFFLQKALCAYPDLVANETNA